jgi:hypothetical protein
VIRKGQAMCKEDDNTMITLQALEGRLMTVEHEILIIMMALGIIADLSDWYACGDELL